MASKIKAMLDGAERLFTRKPERAEITVKVHGELVGPTEVRFDLGTHAVTFDEADYAGGNDHGPNPVQMTLASLAACEAIIYRYYSERLEIPLDELSVDVEGDLDLRGGLDRDDVRAGFQSIRMTVHVAGSGAPDQYEKLHGIVGKNCPVLDALANSVRVTTSLDLMK